MSIFNRDLAHMPDDSDKFKIIQDVIGFTIILCTIVLLAFCALEPASDGTVTYLDKEAMRDSLKRNLVEDTARINAQMEARIK
jgi:hypothetical protein